MKQKNFIIAISSPSGAGKTSISKQLLASDPKLSLSISVTTREMRPGEVDGIDYFFVNPTEFKKMSQNNEFIEEAKVFDHHYASPKRHLLEMMNSGKDVLFDIDWQGAMTLKEKMPDKIVSIFILPPSLKELERRLRLRAQDSEEIVQNRMKKASFEISKYFLYDYVLVNEDFNKTLAKISAIITAERTKRSDFSGFVEKILNDD